MTGRAYAGTHRNTCAVPVHTSQCGCVCTWHAQSLAAGDVSQMGEASFSSTGALTPTGPGIAMLATWFTMLLVPSCCLLQAPPGRHQLGNRRGLPEGLAFWPSFSKKHLLMRQSGSRSSTCWLTHPGGCSSQDWASAKGLPELGTVLCCFLRSSAGS